MMPRLYLLLAALWLAGCSTSKEQLLPPGDSTMLDLWQQKSGSPQMAAEARAVLRRDLNDVERNAQPAVAESYSRDANSEIQQQFPRLPNPDLVMYVFPHMTVGNVPVPGYSTVFPFYSQVQYALPGERVGAL
ncbi:TPA: TIGR03751 family conjugal transfer lipoprotein [Klebsiella pneumoniae]|jgi:conjugative transfer region lipoprotein (TIGR03751 family)|uniref:TIGR03751 family conjugal transfer lipoprotein n=1 Tax=Klebsiella pneumoniae TaxID=573 RepID=UPI000E2B0AF9|nr:TIGR03751 family conjugal transfer lipoprotein [Klebsiella pneumoniae]HDS2595401.1 TIGR03751 family conjugal transfer lipoprotein [Klebsiella pneumoniae subsp. pneumoniae]MDG3468699.1 TIGR03751 family conjugal transfer lipoprotein [Klebsiella pneumoniae]MDS0189456.1 TIGR03751 family conjugal transfer lipoprotein [Klebsiella pneumoniae]MDS1064419.1 TIGR03751 family conjugal transfer lipoprotein [Klebsiella pneumoniae]MDS1120576.1 TIGR03751 family conjugal transfer lipoprotein [Klebsiella pne